MKPWKFSYVLRNKKKLFKGNGKLKRYPWQRLHMKCFLSWVLLFSVSLPSLAAYLSFFLPEGSERSEMDCVLVSAGRIRGSNSNSGWKTEFSSVSPWFLMVSWSRLLWTILLSCSNLLLGVLLSCSTLVLGALLSCSNLLLGVLLSCSNLLLGDLLSCSNLLLGVLLSCFRSNLLVFKTSTNGVRVMLLRPVFLPLLDTKYIQILEFIS